MHGGLQWRTSNQATQLNFTSKVGVYLKELQQILHVPVPTFHFHSHFPRIPLTNMAVYKLTLNIR